MKSFYFPIFVLFLSACSTVEIKSQPDLCSEQRLPSSQKMKCLALFEENNLHSYLAKANEPDSGYSQAKFTSTSGLVHREGPKTPVQNPKQVVSFYTETNSDGTPNRGGVMIQGTPTEIMFDQNQKPAYVVFGGQKIRILEFSANFDHNPTQNIKGQGFDRHHEGFSSPMGLLKGWKSPIAEYSIQELQNLFEKYTDKNGRTTLEFESGITVSGVIEKYTENKSGNYRSPTVITFQDCDVKLGDRYLYRHEWGPYDMILVTNITEANASTDSPTHNPDL